MYKPSGIKSFLCFFSDKVLCRKIICQHVLFDTNRNAHQRQPEFMLLCFHQILIHFVCATFQLSREIIYRSFVLIPASRCAKSKNIKLKIAPQKMDRNHDGVVTIDEFLECCRCDQAITNSMLVFDSTIWPSNELDGNRRNFTSSLSSQKAARDEQRDTHIEHNRQPSHHRAAISSQSTRLSVQHNGNGSTKSKLYDNHAHKILSPSFGENSKQQNGPTTEQQQNPHPLHNPHHPVTVFANKTRNNVGHKASQTKRIQLSTAAKRCKSINRSNAVDNNNSKAINLDDICKADDVEGEGGKGDNDDDNCAAIVNTPNQRHNVDVDTIANNSISTQSTESPTLVKVKTWYTEASVALPSSQGVIFWYWTFLLFIAIRSQPKVSLPFTSTDDKEVKFRQFYDLWHFCHFVFLAVVPSHFNGRPPLEIRIDEGFSLFLPSILLYPIAVSIAKLNLRENR